MNLPLVRCVRGRPWTRPATVGTPTPGTATRLEARGKCLFAGDRKVYLQGATYGTFPPNSEGDLLPERPIVDRVRAGVRSCAGHPAVACYAVGNGIPAPLPLTELGPPSRRSGETRQARAVDWQVRSTFSEGAAGAFVFAWTDEWFRGERGVDDWDFGLTTRSRSPKPALDAARRAFEQVPLPPKPAASRISVVVCTYNGGGTIGETLEHLAKVACPAFEVIVVDDGSADDTLAIECKFGVRGLGGDPHRKRGRAPARGEGALRGGPRLSERS